MQAISLKDLKYSLEIDEEGYPLVSGMRIEDDEFLKELFGNLQRALPNEPRSKLVSKIGSSWAWIDAFDEALVVQSVLMKESLYVTLCFLGGLEEKVEISSLQVDAWNRFHAYVGVSRLPAVFSRKAQAELLNLFLKFDLNPTPSAYRSPQQNKPQNSNMWEEAYLAQNTGWDLGSAHPYLNTFIASPFWEQSPYAKQDFELWVPGAGAGHDAVFWAQHSKARITALDFAPSALKKFHDAYNKLSLTQLNFRIEDVFEALKQSPEASVDIVFEHTFFCAISPLERQKYLSEIQRILKPKGLWLGIYFLLEHEEGPPYALTQWELREHTKENFLIQQWHRIAESPSGRTHKELWGVFQKK